MISSYTKFRIVSFYLNHLISEDEYKQFIKYFDEVLNSSSSFNSPLFPDSQHSNNPICAAWVSTYFSQLFNGLSGLSFTFHSLRHTAVNNLFLLVESQSQLIKRLGDYDNALIKKVDSYLFGKGDKCTKYLEIARFSGHRGPDTTFSNYVHFIREVGYLSMLNSELTLPISFVKSTTIFSSQKINRMISCYSSNMQISYRAILSSNIDFKQQHMLSEISKPEEEHKDVLDMEVIALINMVDELASAKLSINEVSSKYGLEHEELNQICTNMNLISKLKNKKGLQRFPFRKGAEVCLPKLPRNKEQIQDLKSLGNVLFKYMEVNNYQSSLDYFLEHATYTSSELPFYQKRELKKILKPFKDSLLLKRFILRVQVPKNRNTRLVKTYWASAGVEVIIHSKIISSNQKQRKEYPNGIAQLSFRVLEIKIHLGSLKRMDTQKMPLLHLSYSCSLLQLSS